MEKKNQTNKVQNIYHQNLHTRNTGQARQSVVTFETF